MAERKPITAQSVVPDSLETVGGTFHVGDAHTSRPQELYLLVKSVGRVLRRECVASIKRADSYTYLCRGASHIPIGCLSTEGSVKRFLLHALLLIP